MRASLSIRPIHLPSGSLLQTSAQLEALEQHQHGALAGCTGDGTDRRSQARYIIYRHFLEGLSSIAEAADQLGRTNFE